VEKAMKFIEKAPRDLFYTEEYNKSRDEQREESSYGLLEPELDMKISKQDVEEIAEIFNTPLTGSYNWDYQLQDNRIRRLYNLGKKLNWDAEIDIDWEQKPRKLSDEEIEFIHPFMEYPEYTSMSDQDKDNFNKHMHAWTISQFLHGEQGALLVASQLVSCAPTYNAKLYASSQAFDEARHVEVFTKYLNDQVGLRYPISNELKSLLDKILTDSRWDLKFIGMQIVIEGLALSAFNAIKAITPSAVLHDILDLVIRDEARHVTFGVNYLEEFVSTLSEEEKNDRAMFAYEACVISRERLVPTDVFEYWGWNVEEARKLFLEGNVTSNFRKLLFTRVMPNLKRIGLLTEDARVKFEELGILEYENLATDGDIDWAELERPLNIKNDAA
jgi:ribonucleotide reductase beta subunit family protein with ferritin-like domain